MKRSTSLLRSVLVIALLGMGSTGCSVLDLVDPPTFELSDVDRACVVDEDCSGVEIVEERGTLIPDSDPDGEAGPMPACLVARVACNTNRGVCEAQVTVRDADADGFFDPTCPGYNFAPLAEDCDDGDPDIKGRDTDGDGQVSTLCTREPGTDCEDNLGSVFSGATVETCDGFISDCEAWVVGESPARPAEDRDGDAVAAPDAPCEPGTEGSRGVLVGFLKTDCDDDNVFVFPGAPEVCDGFINDCAVGSGPRAGEDGDGDGFALLTADCEDSEAFPKTDCDDTNRSTYPGAPEVCDRITNDCNMPQVVQVAEDRDDDGFASYDAPCAPGPIPYGDCIGGGDNDASSRFCPFIEEFPSLDDTLVNASGVAILDLTGDGRADILAGNASGAALRAYYQQASGGFSSPANLPTSAALRALRIGPLFDDPNATTDDDVDDVVVVNGSSGQVTVLCNPNAVAALDAASLPVVSGARDAVVVRVTANTQAVAYISPLAGTLHLSETSGTLSPRCNALTFTSSTISMGAVSPTAITGGRLLTRATDLEDIVVVTTTGSAFLFANAPAETEGFELVATPIATGMTGALSATAGDFDGDGRIDLAVGTSTGAHAVMNTDGTAAGFEASAIEGSPTDVVSMYSRDINLDGRDDLITASSAEDSVDWWELVDDTWVRHSLVSDFNEASAAVAGDVDSDGDLDVVASARGAGTVTWWTTEIVSNASFQRANVDRAFDGASVSLSADMNGDSRPDIVGLGTDLLSWWTVEGTATAPVYTESVIAALEDGDALASGDLDDDGAPDLVVADDDGLRVMLNGSTGGSWMTLAGPAGLGASGVGLIDVVVGDVTGDGALDIVGITATSVQYWESSGTSPLTFTNTSVGAQTIATSVALGDVNGDDRLDIVVSNGASMATPGVQVFSRATATAAFTATVIADAPSASHVVVGDLDGDGTDEIFSGERNFGALVAYWTWTGTAYERHVISTAFESTWTHRLELADLDSDGDLDLAVAFGATVAVRWFENVNETDSGWVSHLVTNVGSRAEALAAADYDVDGDVDLVVAHEGDSEVILYKNDGVAWWRPSGR